MATCKSSSKPTKRFQLERRSFQPKETAPFTDLPFIKRVGRHGPLNYWGVPQQNDYGDACHLGDQFFADFAQYLKDNPSVAGWGLVRDVMFAAAKVSDTDDTKGVAVGFCSMLELALCDWARRTDPYEFTQRHVDHLRRGMEQAEAEKRGNVTPIRKEAA